MIKNKTTLGQGLIKGLEYAVAYEEGQASALSTIRSLEDRVAHLTQLLKQAGECGHGRLAWENDIMRKALKEINKAELNEMRPGGGYSTSARLSYNALNEVDKK